MKAQLISIQRIFANMSKFMAANNISEDDVIEWTGQALEFMKLETVFQPALKIIEVSNFAAPIPSYLHAIIQIARNNEWVSETTSSTEEEDTEEIVDVPVALDETGMPVNAYDLAYYRPFADFDGETFTVGGLQVRKYQFTPVRLANHHFFGSLVCQETDFAGIYATCKDEYTIVDNVLKFSFQEGQIMLSYFKQKLDENGYPMIPDDISAITAIGHYIRYKTFEEQFDKGREGSERRYLKAEADWQWYCRQAKSEDLMPQTVDEWQNILDWKNHMMPKWNQYYTFFGKLAHPQMLKM